MAGDAIKVEGLKALAKDLKKLEDDTLKELKKIGKDAAEIVADAARPLTPVLSGKLKGTIKPGSTQSGAYVSAGGKLAYANPIHFGWRRHNIAPNPFLYHALDARREEVVDTYFKSVERLIDKTIEGSYVGQE